MFRCHAYLPSYIPNPEGFRMGASQIDNHSLGLGLQNCPIQVHTCYNPSRDESLVLLV